MSWIQLKSGLMAMVRVAYRTNSVPRACVEEGKAKALSRLQLVTRKSNLFSGFYSVKQ